MGRPPATSHRRRLVTSSDCRALVLVTCVAACSTGPESAPVHAVDGPARAPAPYDSGEHCMDVGEGARACWGSADPPQSDCARGVCSVPRPLLEGAAVAWNRCAGAGDERRCEPRSNRAGPFRCDGARCVQERPRMPDTAEWLCVEMHGGVFCRSPVQAAGIETGTRDPAFLCGSRRGGTKETICVDFNPDPPPLGSPWSCRFEYGKGVAERVCRPSEGPKLGSRCASTEACPRGAHCVGHRCLPPAPSPACWLDDDCPKGGACRWGSCAPEPLP